MTIVNDYQKILDNSTDLYSMRKPNKTWVDKSSEFYNSSFKKQLKNNDTLLYSTLNEGKYVAAERLIRILENKIYKHMTAVLKKCVY